MSKKTYSISELAIQLQLPRTTINDWLKTFAPYLEFEMKGKRKEYNTNALEVLKNISLWKNEGKSASAIQKLLEENYGIQGEITEKDTKNTVEQNDITATAQPSDSGELMQVVHSDLEMLLANVEKMNEKRIRSTRKAAWSSIFFMFLILCGVAAIGYFVYISVENMQQKNDSARKEYNEKISTLQQQNKKQLDEISRLRRLELDKLNSNFNIRDKKFQQELAAQRAELTAEFNKLAKNVAAQREIEILKLREAFAAEQRALLEKLIAREKELSKINAKMAELQKNINFMQKINSELQNKNQSLTTSIKQILLEKKQLEQQKKELEQSLSRNAGDAE